jgi:hypothetical protein
MATVLLGSTSPRTAPEGTSVSVNNETVAVDENAPKGKSVVLIETPQGAPLDKQLLEVRNAFALHSNSDAVWIEGHDEFFCKAVSQMFVDCKIGRPSDWDAAETSQEDTSDHWNNEGGAVHADEDAKA